MDPLFIHPTIRVESGYSTSLLAMNWRMQNPSLVETNLLIYTFIFFLLLPFSLVVIENLIAVYIREQLSLHQMKYLFNSNEIIIHCFSCVPLNNGWRNYFFANVFKMYYWYMNEQVYRLASRKTDHRCWDKKSSCGHDHSFQSHIRLTDLL